MLNYLRFFSRFLLKVFTECDVLSSAGRPFQGIVNGGVGCFGSQSAGVLTRRPGTA